ncbi:hypothetical protein DPEC_G00027930 [Dallia pectoralis]|uniref:Uncharacterized protein n=1 Tax=Dallia pectoralis TaxID=75939 RepID=A0ACC2HHV5_DALPE|nr:hypothetical protein DPEC_G00027930 [Dallia pectoralis]
MCRLPLYTLCPARYPVSSASCCGGIRGTGWRLRQRTLSQIKHLFDSLALISEHLRAAAYGTGLPLAGGDASLMSLLHSMNLGGAMGGGRWAGSAGQIDKSDGPNTNEIKTSTTMVTCYAGNQQVSC